MKKLIFLAILIISSLIFGEPHVTKKYYFIANKLHCTQPDYRITKFYQAMGGNMTLIFKNCYSNNVKMNYSDFTIILTNVKKDAYERILSKQYPYLFFEDGSKIHVLEYSDNTISFAIDVDRGEGNYWFKNDNIYPAKSEWE
jgi:hypothetical protein